MADLSKATAAVGRPLTRTGVLRVEMDSRRCDVDDLVALAIALDVTPSRLLLSSDAGTDPIALTDTITRTKAEAWYWAAGERALEIGPWYERAAARHQENDRAESFYRASHPHKPTDKQVLATVSRHLDAAPALTEAIRTAVEAGIDVETIQAYVGVVVDDMDREEQRAVDWEPDWIEHTKGGKT